MTKLKFGDIAINSTAKKKPVETDKETYLGLENLDSENLEVTRFGAEVAPKGEKLLMKKGDVLFGKRRAYQKKVAIAPFDGIFSAHGMVLRPNTDVITSEFFPFFISSDYFLDAAIKISVGSLSPTINWKDLKELEFNIPDINTQKKLSDLLWAIENNKRALNKAIVKTKQYKDVFIDSYLAKKIQLPDSNISAWSEMRWDELFEEYIEKTTELNQYEVLSSTVGGLFSQTDYFNKEIASVNNVGYKVLKRGQVVFSPQNLWLGNINLNDNYDIGMVSPSYKVYQPDLEKLNYEFAKYMIKSTHSIKQYTEASEQGASIVRRNLNMELFNAILFNIPPVIEQVGFVEYVGQIEKQELSLTEELAKIKALSKAILDECYGG
jgi:type I restriction enzyme S subunit